MSGTNREEISKKLNSLTITNSERGAISNASAIPENTGLNVTTNYTLTFLPKNPLSKGAILKIKIPEEITIVLATDVNCPTTSLTYIEPSLVCVYEPANRIVTVTKGFEISATYPQSLISFKINGLVNPKTALTTQSFTIETKDSAGISIDYIGTGITYTKSCNSPCLTCEGDLSKCTSCVTASGFPLLYLNT